MANVQFDVEAVEFWTGTPELTVKVTGLNDEQQALVKQATDELWNGAENRFGTFDTRYEPEKPKPEKSASREEFMQKLAAARRHDLTVHLGTGDEAKALLAKLEGKGIEVENPTQTRSNITTQTEALIKLQGQMVA